MTTAVPANNSNNPAVITVSSKNVGKYTSDNFIKVDQNILHATKVNGVKMTANMKLVYMAMMSWHRAGKPAILSSESVMTICGLSSDKSARTLIKSLLEAGLIKDVKRGYHEASVYTPNEYVIETEGEIEMLQAVQLERVNLSCMLSKTKNNLTMLTAATLGILSSMMLLIQNSPM